MQTLLCPMVLGVLRMILYGPIRSEGEIVNNEQCYQYFRKSVLNALRVAEHAQNATSRVPEPQPIETYSLKVLLSCTENYIKMAIQ